MRKFPVIHPLLFAVFPTLFVYLYNLRAFPVAVSEMIWPIVISLAGTGALWLLLGLVLKNVQKSALITSIFVILFFSYGHLLDLVTRPLGNDADTFSLLTVFGVFAGTLFLLFRKQRNYQPYTRAFNVFGLLLVCLSLFNFGISLIQTARGRVPATLSTASSIAHTENIQNKPDIYYIILDGYGRADVLKELYHLDNQPFIDSIRALGFTVEDNAHTNYNQTVLSLSSSLNLEHLQNLAADVGEDYPNREPLNRLIKHSLAFQFAKDLGYTTVALASGYPYTEITNADIYATPSPRLTEFQNLLINTTPIPKLLEELPFKSQADLHRDMILSSFRYIPKLAKLPQSTFTFAHIFAPHPPFVFNADGSPVKTKRLLRLGDGTWWIENEQDRRAYLEYYRAQVQYINDKVLEMISSIIKNSPIPPIIVLQADHGPGAYWNTDSLALTNVKERFSILSAYFLPGPGATQLYDGITPVNTFRTIFNAYFGTNFERLPDRSYYATLAKPYQFTDVTDQIEQLAAQPR